MPVSETDFDEYLRRELANYESGTFPFPDPILAARIAEKLRASLGRLNHLPSDDPFWRGANSRPTLFKLDTFLKDILRRDSSDDETRWGLIAHALYRCDNDFARDHLLVLTRKDVSNLRWLVAAAIWVARVSGVDTTASLRESLEDLRSTVPDFEVILRQYRDDPDPYTRTLARGAVAVLEDSPIERCPHNVGGM